jgi:hypothetical protein
MDSDEVESSFKLNVTAEFQGKSVQTIFDVRTSMEDIIRQIQLDHKIPPEEHTYHVIRKQFCYYCFCFFFVRVLILLLVVVVV